MGQVGLNARDGIDQMLETGDSVLRLLVSSSSPAAGEAAQKLRESRKVLTEARAAVERIREQS